MEMNGIEAMAQDFEPLIGLFRLLSDKTRLNILMILAKGERNVSSLCEELRLPQPTVSHHLGLLRTKNLISNRRNGKQVFYGLNGAIESDGAEGMRINAEPFVVRVSEKGMSQAT